MTKNIAAIRRTVSVILAVMITLLLVSAVTLRSHAADDYTYRMKISAGNNGVMKLADGSEAAESTVDADSSGNFPTVSTDSVKVTNSKYVVIGFKEAGHDDVMPAIEPVAAKSDLNYVAVYGVKSNMVSYTVRYLDRDGNELMDEATYYAPKGSSVLVSFKYIDGYAPTAYNLTKTLTGSSDDDVLEFRYYESNLTVTQQTTAANATAANPAAPAAAAANPAAAQATIIDNATPGTPNVVNLDEGETPLTSPEDIEDIADAETPEAGINKGVLFAAILAAALVLAAIIAMLVKRSREDYEEDEEGEEE